MEPKLRVRDVYKIFGDNPQDALDRLKRGQTKEEILEESGQVVGVQDATFDVEEAHIFVVMGLSGSGKSTLVRMLNGLIKPTFGQVLIDEDDVASCSPEQLRRIRRNKIAMVFQHFALFPHKTIAENVGYGLKIKGVGAAERRQKALAALDQVGLAAWADSYPSELSGGMQQRVGLARGLATDPQILLMDEPFSALDPLIRREMQEELLGLQKKLKKTIVFITHDLNEALMLGDRIAIMKDGRFVQVGTAQEIVSNPADDYVAAFVADIDRGRVFTAGHVANAPAAVQLSASAEDALQTMEESNRTAVYVLDGEKVAGVVSYQDLSTAARGNGEAGTTLADVLVTDYPSAVEDAQLHELYGLASTGLPVAVLDGKGRLIGVIEPEAVFAQLSGDEQTTQQETGQSETGARAAS
ncbi:glycine betaine/L-proline ABC transporter ATP-binding protein [Chelativorans sp. M5D2P16]|uniref:quaternary amine ABC transporter ATP-binding protein n=1 Tax=Chelativorans sp. M5D2P16 TaxID=3095678 RepID=UPI002ACAD315|nr:glycine betaine/L-proline ABC transporter ATP-binding protein [Chelativorans sp. M5D2P16]MDZ5698909.1 glycine betaine/L-proline ABC transporter ATP-binding protein [Chelativorans sp. M5D2P16]